MASLMAAPTLVAPTPKTHKTARGHTHKAQGNTGKIQLIFYGPINSFSVSTFLLSRGRIVNFEHEKQLYCPPVRYNYVNVSAALDTKMGHVLLYSDLKGNMMYNLKMYL